jgi:hypothetical protein
MTKEKTIYEALLAVQQAAPCIGKTTDNPYFKSKYAALPDIWAAIKELLGQHGLLVMHQTEVVEGAEYIITTIHHVPTQEKIVSRSKIILLKNSAQEYGSYITYMRRYALSAMLGLITDEDDDGNAASQAKPKQEPAVLPVNASEMALLLTGIQTAATSEDLFSAKENAKAAWKRMDKKQQTQITECVAKAEEKLAVVDA